jgi:hypothetical protein
MPSAKASIVGPNEAPIKLSRDESHSEESDLDVKGLGTWASEGNEERGASIGGARDCALEYSGRAGIDNGRSNASRECRSACNLARSLC